MCLTTKHIIAGLSHYQATIAGVFHYQAGYCCRISLPSTLLLMYNTAKQTVTGVSHYQADIRGNIHMLCVVCYRFEPQCDTEDRNQNMSNYIPSANDVYHTKYIWKERLIGPEDT